MTTEKAIELTSEGARLRKNGQLKEAGEIHTKIAYEYLGEASLTPPTTWGSSGLLQLMTAATIFGMASEEFRCLNRCKQGILIADDFREKALEGPAPSNFYDRARRGAWYEYMGDFHLISQQFSETSVKIEVGSHTEVEELYDAAKSIYEEGDDPRISVSEADNDRLQAYFMQVAKGVGFDLTTFLSMREYETAGSLTDWVDYKQNHLPGLLEQLEREETWTWESDTS